MEVSNQNTGAALFGFIFFIIIIVIVSFFIWRFLVEHKGRLPGEFCNIDDECAAGQYCGGGNQCTPGVSGGTIGAICLANSDCQVGLLCKGTSSLMSCQRI